MQKNTPYENLRENEQYLEKQIENKKHICGYGKCPYCDQPITRQDIEAKIKILQAQLLTTQENLKPVYAQYQSECEQQRQQRKTFDQLVASKKPLYLAKAKKIYNKAKNEESFTLPNIPVEDHQIWNALMDSIESDDDDGSLFALEGIHF